MREYPHGLAIEDELEFGKWGNRRADLIGPCHDGFKVADAEDLDFHADKFGARPKPQVKAHDDAEKAGARTARGP